MPSLLDVAPPEIATEIVDIAGTPIEVRGIDARGIAALMKRFPSLRRIAAGREDDESLDEDAAEANGKAQIAAIAAGLVEPVPEDVIERNTNLAERAELFDAIMRLTNPPRRRGPLGGNGAAGREHDTEAPATN